jgi:hypothetical protein
VERVLQCKRDADRAVLETLEALTGDSWPEATSGRMMDLYYVLTCFSRTANLLLFLVFGP